MNTALITAAEAALVELKDYHQMTTLIEDCAGIQNCPTAAAIANLEAEIAMAKLQNDPDPEFQAVAPFKAESIDSDTAHSILQASQQIGRGGAHLE